MIFKSKKLLGANTSGAKLFVGRSEGTFPNLREAVKKAEAVATENLSNPLLECGTRQAAAVVRVTESGYEVNQVDGRERNPILSSFDSNVDDSAVGMVVAHRRKGYRRMYDSVYVYSGPSGIKLESGELVRLHQDDAIASLTAVFESIKENGGSVTCHESSRKRSASLALATSRDALSMAALEQDEAILFFFRDAVHGKSEKQIDAIQAWAVDFLSLCVDQHGRSLDSSSHLIQQMDSAANAARSNVKTTIAAALSNAFESDAKAGRQVASALRTVPERPDWTPEALADAIAQVLLPLIQTNDDLPSVKKFSERIYAARDSIEESNCARAFLAGALVLLDQKLEPALEKRDRQLTLEQRLAGLDLS